MNKMIQTKLKYSFLLTAIIAFNSLVFSQTENSEIVSTKWEVSINSYYTSYPYIVDDYVFIGINKKNAFYAETGESISFGSESLPDLKLFLSDKKKGDLLHLNTGNVICSIDRARKMNPKWYWPQVIENDVVVSSKNLNEIVAVKIENQQDTNTVWKFKSPNKIREHFVYSNGTVLFSDTKTIYSLHIESGLVAWKKSFDKINTLIKKENEICYFVADGCLHSVDLRSGNVKWKSEFLNQSSNLHNFHIGDNSITINLGNIFKISRQDGKIEYHSSVRFWSAKGGAIYKNFYIGLSEPESDDAPLLVINMDTDEVVYENYDRYNGISHFSNKMVENLLFYCAQGKLYCLEINL
jgi:outer membrane protein assembly factor BamB